MSLSVHDKLQKIKADIAALELKQQQLKEHIAHRIMLILDQEQAFAIEPPLLFGSILDAIQKIKKLDNATFVDEKSRLQNLGENFLKRRRLRFSPAKVKPI